MRSLRTARRSSSRRSAAASATSSAIDSRKRGTIENLTDDEFGGLRRRPIHQDGRFIICNVRISGNQKLFRLRSRDRDEDAADLRDRRTKPRRQFVNDRTRSSSLDRARIPQAARARGRAQRQHLQHLDARPERQRAAAVHRRPRRHFLAGGRSTRAAAARVRHLLQGRLGRPRASSARRRSTPRPSSGDFGSPGPSSISRRRSPHTLRHRPTSGRRRCSRTCSCRGSAGERRWSATTATCSAGPRSASATSSATSSSWSTPIRRRGTRRADRTFLFGWTNRCPPLSVHAAGPCADAVLLRRHRGRVLRSVACTALQSRRYAGDEHAARRQHLRHLPAQPLPPRRDVGRPVPGQGVVTATTASRPYRRLRPAGPRPRCFRDGIAIPLSAAFVQETTVFREFGPLSGSTMRLGRWKSNRRSAIRCRAGPSTSTPATTSGWPRTASSPPRFGRSRARATIRGISISAGTREMRGYDYLAVRRGKRACSPTPSCGSRSSRRR